MQHHKQWRNGPNLNENRGCLVAVVCRDQVYATGGYDDNYTALDTVEIIQVSSLLETETSMTRQNNSQWTTLQCRLLSPRGGCAAVGVHNRFVVILGGHTGIEHLSSVDILDVEHQNNNGEPTIVAGPSMNLARHAFGAAVMDNRIFVVGGLVNGGPSTLVESLLFWQQQDKDHTNSYSNTSCTFPNSLWRVEPHLSLSTGRSQHAVAKVGSCLVVAGGFTSGGKSTNSLVVEVLDVQHSIVWNLPNLIFERQRGCSMVTLSDCLVVLGGNYFVDSVESLALTVFNRKHERCYKLLKFLIEIEFLGRPSGN